MWLLASITVLIVSQYIRAQDNDCQVVEIATLKRGFHPGQLYDARTQQLVAALNPWNSSQTAVANLLKRNAQDIDLKISTATSTSERAKLLDLSASIALQIAMIDVSGSASYMKDTQKTEYEESFVAVHRSLTHHLELKPELLNSITYPESLTANAATHVVTKVTYGANAVFKFTKKSSSKIDSKAVSGDVSIKATLGPVIISGKGSVDFSSTEKDEYQSIECRFYGDMRLPDIPTNAVQAMDVLKTINRNINEDTTVDVKATLLPIHCIPGQTNRVILHKIKDSLLKRVMTRVDEYEYMLRKVNDLDRTLMAQSFAGVRAVIANYRRHCSTVHTDFLGQLAVLLPEVRGTGNAEKRLGDLLEQYPDITDMKQFVFVRSRTTEDIIVSQYPTIKDLLLTGDQLLVKKLQATEGVLIVLNLDLRGLTDCDDSCVNDDSFDLPECGFCLREMSESWRNGPFMDEFQKTLDTFEMLREWNRDDDSVQFAVSELMQNDQGPTSSISVWQGLSELHSDVTILNVLNVRGRSSNCSDRQLIEWDTVPAEHFLGGQVQFKLTSDVRTDATQAEITSTKSGTVSRIAGSVLIMAICDLHNGGSRGRKAAFVCGYEQSPVQANEDCPVTNGVGISTACKIPGSQETGFSCKLRGSKICLSEQYVVDGNNNCDDDEDERWCELNGHQLDCEGLDRLWNRCVFEPDSHGFQCQCNKHKTFHTSGKCHAGPKKTCVRNGRIGYPCVKDGKYQCLNENVIGNGAKDCDNGLDEDWCWKNADWQLNCAASDCGFDHTKHEFRCMGTCSDKKATGLRSFTRSSHTISTHSHSTEQWQELVTYAAPITPAKDQKGCGASWAFAMTAMLEAAYLSHSGQTVDMSEQALISCTVGKPGMSGCSGADLPRAMRFILYPVVMEERSMSFSGINSVCEKKGQLLGRINALVRRCRFKSKSLSPSPSSKIVFVDNMFYLKRLIKETGPVVFAFNVYDSFRQYWAQNATQVYRFDGQKKGKTGHAVLAFGWDDTKRAIKLKNSWGSCGPLGDGTFYLSYDDAAHLNYHAAIIDLPWECVFNDE